MAASTTTRAPTTNESDIKPPSYTPAEGDYAVPSSSAAEHHGQAPLSVLPFQSGHGSTTTEDPVVLSKTISSTGDNNNSDLEDGSNSTNKEKRGKVITVLGRSFKRKHNGGLGCFFGILGIILFIAVIGAIGFGISVGVERGLTGEDYWSPNHNSLFRICESDSTSSKPFQLHTCNVFRPNQDVESPPVHSFVESVRSWSTGTGAKLQGQARRIDAVRLDALLLTYELRCTVPANVQPPPAGKEGSDAQLIIGGVGQGYDRKKHATACNYFADGKNSQDHCARYNDGGIKSIGKTHPLGINAIMRKHFNMTCEWVA